MDVGQITIKAGLEPSQIVWMALEPLQLLLDAALVDCMIQREAAANFAPQVGLENIDDGCDHRHGDRVVHACRYAGGWWR